MSLQPEAPYCLVTVSDAAFAIATEVLVYSFLKFNPWFEGDVLVVEDDLPEAARARLAQLGPVRFLPPDPRLVRQIEAVRAAAPGLDSVYRRFYSFELFRIRGYGRAVYLDSDIYCAGCVAPLFAGPEPLCACPDGFTYGDRILGLLADADADAGGGQPAPQVRYGQRFARSFNAGVLSVGASLLGEETYAALLAMLQPERWLALGPSKFTDQMALNILFAERFTPLPAIYNYMIFIEEYQKCCEQICSADARLVHFAGPIKPWHTYDPAALAERAPQFARFIEVWRELLREARATDSRGDLAAAYRRQKDWITAFNADPLQPTGRLF